MSSLVRLSKDASRRERPKKEALENIKDAIKTYLESIEDLKRLKKLRTVEVSV